MVTPDPDSPELAPLLDRGRGADARIVVLTGAGVSADSGVPTFRGPEGYWTVGSRDYHPQEMATQQAFQAMPDEVWAWYLHRRGVCRAAGPNPAHHAIARLMDALGRRVTLITQNVDGLHPLASAERSPGARARALEQMCEVHGDIDRMRCVDLCAVETYAVPAAVPPPSRGEPVAAEVFERLLRCPRCGGPSRPHVLWFDERYDERLYRSETAMAAASRADLFVVAGSSGSTSLPIHAAAAAGQAGAAFLDVNPNDNPFAVYARDRGEGPSGGAWVQASAAEALPALVDRLLA